MMCDILTEYMKLIYLTRTNFLVNITVLVYVQLQKLINSLLR